MATPSDTLDDLLEQWRIHGGWKPSKADFQRLVDEIERLREQNTGLGVRVQEGWAKIEKLEDGLATVVRNDSGDKANHCSTFTGRSTCRDPHSGRTRGARYGAEAWCDACIAADALGLIPPRSADA